MILKESVIFFLILFLFDEIFTIKENKTDIHENDRHKPTKTLSIRTTPFFILYTLYHKLLIMSTVFFIKKRD